MFTSSRIWNAVFHRFLPRQSSSLRPGLPCYVTSAWSGHNDYDKMANVMVVISMLCKCLSLNVWLCLSLCVWEKVFNSLHSKRLCLVLGQCNPTILVDLPLNLAREQIHGADAIPLAKWIWIKISLLETTIWLNAWEIECNDLGGEGF